MRRVFAAGVALALFGSAAMAQSRNVEAGAELAKRNCGMCHAIGPEGASPNKAAPPFRELGKRYPPENLQEALAEGILTGHPAMPQFRFSPSEINQLIDYLKALQAREHAALKNIIPAKAGTQISTRRG